MSELQRVLAALDAYGRRNGAGVHADAARLLRELAADFARYCEHDGDCMVQVTHHSRAVCGCGLDAAREKWRLL